MSCCGQRRVGLATGLSPVKSPMTSPMTSGLREPGPVAPMTPGGPASAGRSLEFERVAEGPLVVDGQASGRRYRFEARGSRVAVDRRDWAQMFRVAGLRHVG